MATLKELRDQIVIDSGVQGNPKFPILRLNRIINLACRYVQTELNGLGMKKWESSVALGTPSSGTFGGTSIKKVAISTLINMLESPNSILFSEVDDGASY